MHTCEYLMPDDYECGDTALIRKGKRWYCREHSHELEQDEILPYDDFMKGETPC